VQASQASLIAVRSRSDKGTLRWSSYAHRPFASRNSHRGALGFEVNQGFPKNLITTPRIAISPEATPLPRFFDQFADDFVRSFSVFGTGSRKQIVDLEGKKTATGRQQRIKILLAHGWEIPLSPARPVVCIGIVVAFKPNEHQEHARTYKPFASISHYL